MSKVEIKLGELSGGTVVDSGTISAMGNTSTTITFSKTFTNPPDIFVRPVTPVTNYPYLGVHGTAYYQNLTATGVKLKNIYWVKGDWSGNTTGGTIEWIAVGD